MSVSIKSRSVLVHVLVWTFWLLMPVMFSLADVRQRPLTFHNWIPMVFSVVLFYTNYLWLVERFLFRKRFLWFFIINFAAIVTSVFLAELIRNTFFVWEGHKPPRQFIISGMVFSFVFVISISLAIRTTARWFKLDTERRALENENLRSELNNLKMQLNPHFFFNTLNNIYSLIQLSPDRAMEAVHGLARLMRYHLYETNAEKVPVAGEVDFMKSYVSLMQLRTNANVQVDQAFQFEHGDDEVAPLLFVPLLENAFKHGVSSDQPSLIRIHLEEKQHVLSLVVENSLLSSSGSGDDNKGIGLDNLQKRLQLIYPNRHRFESGREGDVFRVKLVIQLV